MNEDLTEKELLKIADCLEPNILLPLAIQLSLDTSEYLRMEEEILKENLAFMILYKWRESCVESPQNRIELVRVLFDLKKVKLAKMVASKSYHSAESDVNFCVANQM